LIIEVIKNYHKNYPQKSKCWNQEEKQPSYFELLETQFHSRTIPFSSCVTESIPLSRHLRYIAQILSDIIRESGSTSNRQPHQSGNLRDNFLAFRRYGALQRHFDHY